MGKKSFRGISQTPPAFTALMEGTQAETPETMPAPSKRESKQKPHETTPRTKAKKQDPPIRKTFLLTPENARILEAWAWYSRKTEKAVFELAFAAYIASVNAKTLKKALADYNEFLQNESPQ